VRGARRRPLALIPKRGLYVHDGDGKIWEPAVCHDDGAASRDDGAGDLSAEFLQKLCRPAGSRRSRQCAHCITETMSKKVTSGIFVFCFDDDDDSLDDNLEQITIIQGASFLAKRKATMMTLRVEPGRLPLSIRLPAELKAWLEVEAARNDRSQSSEVIQILRARMDNELKKAAG
jgi:hypothetical protein